MDIGQASQIEKEKIGRSANLTDPVVLTTSNRTEYWFLLLLIVPVVTLFGNSLVVLSVIRERSLRNATNWFIVSLAISDIILAILSMPVATWMEKFSLASSPLRAVLKSQMTYGRWNFGNAMCNIFIMLDIWFCTASILNLVAISLDRYLAVTRPISYAKRNNVQRIQLSIAAVWIVSLLISVPVVCGINDIGEFDTSVCRSRNATYIITSSVGSFYIPAIALLALYHRIFAIIRRRHKLADQSNRSMNSDLVVTGGLTSANAQMVNTPVNTSEKTDGTKKISVELEKINTELIRLKRKNSLDLSMPVKACIRQATSELSSNESEFDGPREDIASPELEWVDSPKCGQAKLKAQTDRNVNSRRCISMPHLYEYQVTHHNKDFADRRYHSVDFMKPHSTAPSSGSLSVRSDGELDEQNRYDGLNTAERIIVNSNSSIPKVFDLDNITNRPDISLTAKDVCNPTLTNTESPLSGMCHSCTGRGAALSCEVWPRYSSLTDKSKQFIYSFKCCWKEVVYSNQSSSSSALSDSFYSSYAMSDEYTNSAGNMRQDVDESYESNPECPIIPCRTPCTGSPCLESCLSHSYIEHCHCENCKQFTSVSNVATTDLNNTSNNDQLQTTENGSKPFCSFKPHHSKLWLKSRLWVKKKQIINQQKRSKNVLVTKKSCHGRYSFYQIILRVKKSSLGSPAAIERLKVIGLSKTKDALEATDPAEQIKLKPITPVDANGVHIVAGNRTHLTSVSHPENVIPSPDRSLVTKSTNSAGKEKRRVSFWVGKQKLVSSREKKATKTLAIVLGAFLACWLPFFTVNVTIGICIIHDAFDLPVCFASSHLMSACTWLGYVNSLLNPIIYTIFNLEFRAAFKRILRIK
ncbi:Dopamine D2 receptor [Fasciola gigantica]|uniref:Dopamine D2 receptor n=1 Tax=Fasciola gigantica TaxID=46835 RepID=A0A504YYC9_FASGI|nr:Dopamine D2 receptor [Fasciola gigantica]